MSTAGRVNVQPRRRRIDRAQDLPQVSATAQDVARRAYDLFLARGCEHGHDLDDWLTAEREMAPQGRGEG